MSELFCDPCKLLNNSSQATAFCKECEELLCCMCVDIHAAQKATKMHIPVDIKDNLNQNQTRCDLCNSIPATQICKECTETYCDSCSKLHKVQEATKDHTIVSASEMMRQENQDCNPCLYRKVKSPAEKYCLECMEYMCNMCSSSHQVRKATKSHKLVNKGDRASGQINTCDVCKLADKKQEAIFTCHECEENLCHGCKIMHEQQKATRDHQIYDQTNKPAEMDRGSTALYAENKDGFAGGQSEEPEKKSDKRKPGQPSASKIKADSLELYWTKPGAFTTGDSYQVRCKDLDAAKSKWKFMPNEYTTNTINICDLKANTKFIFQVRLIKDDEEGPYSEVSEEVYTLISPGGRLKGFSKVVEEGNPSKYAIPLTELRNARCAAAKSKKFEIGCPSHTIKERTIMLVGATGTGKSTLVDGLVNYILGVNWNDPYRFTIIDLEDEEKQRTQNQALSQTEWITCYTVNPEKGSRLDYRLTIIDTPGFGDTRGLKRDNEIVNQIRELFSAKNEKGVAVIDAVCFLIKAPDARLTATQKYIFHAIMSLFGQDIEKNICSLITFADGQEPPVIASLEEANLPFGRYFTFNNSGLFSRNTQLDSSSLSPMFWEMGVKSYRAFFDNLTKMETKSLLLTKQVLEERQKLEITISSLQPQVDAGLSTVQSLKQELKIIEQHQADIKDNKNFEYEVDETHQLQKDLPMGQHVTNCLHCHVTCHESCAFANDEDKRLCAAMDQNGNCEICSKKCSWLQHKNTPYIFSFVTKKVKKTYQEKLQRYQDAEGQLLNAEQVLEKMYKEFEELEEGISHLMVVVNESNNRLKEIALRPNPLSMVEHIDLMIEAEKMEKKTGFQGRISALMEYKKKAEIAKDVERLNKEAIGARREQPKNTKKTGFNLMDHLKKFNPF